MFCNIRRFSPPGFIYPPFYPADNRLRSFEPICISRLRSVPPPPPPKLRGKRVRAWKFLTTSSLCFSSCVQFYCNLMCACNVCMYLSEIVLFVAAFLIFHPVISKTRPSFKTSCNNGSKEDSDFAYHGRTKSSGNYVSVKRRDVPHLLGMSSANCNRYAPIGGGS